MKLSHKITNDMLLILKHKNNLYYFKRSLLAAM